MSTDPKIVVYGSYGYTGELIVEEAVRRGIKPFLSGRNAEKLKAQADQYGLEWQACDINDDERLRTILKDAFVVIHSAGPFMYTAQQMAEACLATNTHYTDITGEYQVFELAKSMGDKAAAQNLTFLPGTGFDVVPSDCLAAHLKSRLPDATNLALAFTGLRGGVSRGTAKTMVENLGYGGAVRENGVIKRVKNAWKYAEIDFGEIRQLAASIPWGDISSAHFSTGIPNIHVLMGVTPGMLKNMKRGNFLGWLFRMQWMKNYLTKKIDQRRPGPSKEKREKAVTFLWGKVENASGETKVSRLKVPEGYTLTAITAVDIAKRISEGDFKPGYQTPSTAYGADYILGFDGCTRSDD